MSVLAFLLLSLFPSASAQMPSEEIAMNIQFEVGRCESRANQHKCDTVSVFSSNTRVPLSDCRIFQTKTDCTGWWSKAQKVDETNFEFSLVISRGFRADGTPQYTYGANVVEPNSESVYGEFANGKVTDTVWKRGRLIETGPDSAGVKRLYLPKFVMGPVKP